MVKDPYPVFTGPEPLSLWQKNGIAVKVKEKTSKTPLVPETPLGKPMKKLLKRRVL